MELRHLHCFLAVAEELHFARAAETLHIEQSLLVGAILHVLYAGEDKTLHGVANFLSDRTVRLRSRCIG